MNLFDPYFDEDEEEIVLARVDPADEYLDHARLTDPEVRERVQATMNMTMADRALVERT